MMIDFSGPRRPAMVNMQNEMLQKAADHLPARQFHGAYKPTGRKQDISERASRRSAEL